MAAMMTAKQMGGWLEAEYDGTDMILRASPSGIEGSFTVIYSEAAATYVGTPTHIGLCAYSSSGNPSALAADAWVRVA